jgi:DNA-binding beta-propeller fold protein YncE
MSNGLLVAVSLLACGIASAAPVYISAGGQFASSDTAGPMVAPNGLFTFQFALDTNPNPMAGSVTSVGFDVPFSFFSYTLNGSPVSAAPSEIRFNTATNGGLFDIFFGTGINAPELSFQGMQAFSGTTAAPTISLGNYSISSWTYSDGSNYDAQTPANQAVSISPVPEPSSTLLFVCGFIALGAVTFRRSGKNEMHRNILRSSALSLVLIASAWAEVPVAQVMNIPNTGQQITPLAARGARFTYLNPGLVKYPDHVVGQAVTTVSSPDHKTLLVLTTGDYGIYTSAGARDTAASTDWVFVFDTTLPVPVQKQAIQVTNTYNGIVFDPSGTTFYVAGGRNDNVHIYSLAGGIWAEQAGSPIALGHVSQAGGTPPEAAGIAITADGTKLVVTNYENDAISVLTKVSGVWSKTADFDLRPGKISPALSGTAGGAYPFWVSIKGNSTAYISCMRDREIDVVNIAGSPALTDRVKLKGQPLKSVLNAAQTTLYVAEDQTDSVAAIDTGSNIVSTETSVAAPVGIIPVTVAGLSGNNTNSVTLSPDEATLYLTNGNTNNIAVVSVGLLNNGNPVLGLIPTGMYPNSVTLSADGKFMYIVNGKSPAGPNVDHCRGSGAILPNLTSAGCNSSNGYSLQLVKAGLQFLPTPPINQLAGLTNQVAVNNNYQSAESASTKATMDFLASKIKHIVYIIKENRTYDQVLGDLPFANGDPDLTEFPASVTPNLHNVATNFVTLDNFFDTSEVSYDGWAWSTGAIAPDIVLRQTPVNYSFRGGLAYESEGDIRGINLVARTGTNASDPDVLPGPVDVAAPDGPGSEVNTGYLWDQALRAGLTVRNYGFFVDNIGSAVAFPGSTTRVQVRPANFALSPNTDLYFRGYDLNNADYFLYQEWARDFDANAGSGGFAALNLLRLPHNHTGNFATALAGVNTPELEVADNDYAVGLVIDKIAHSAYADSTLVFVIEDDAQNGGDHVDSHRSIAFIAGPYVKHNAVVSTQYNTINFLRTMERILGLAPIHLTDAVAQPMADVFDTAQTSWTYAAAPAPILYNTTLPLPPRMSGLKIPKPTHDAKYWARVTEGLDFSKEDRVDPDTFNRILWQGLKGNQVYPHDANLAETRKRYNEAVKKRKLAFADADGE